MSVVRGAVAISVRTLRTLSATWGAFRVLPHTKAAVFRRAVGRTALVALGRWEIGVQNLTVNIVGVDHPVMRRLGDDARGLHAQLPAPHGVSVLVPAGLCESGTLATTLRACQALSAPQLETIVGFIGEPQRVQRTVVREVDAGGSPVRCLSVANGEDLVSSMLRCASYPYALLVEPGDWVRPDMLYRYELILRRDAEGGGGVVIACASRTLDPTGALLPGLPARTSAQPHFPVVLSVEALASGVLIPTVEARQAADGIYGGSFLAVILETVRRGARFRYVPVPLSARAHTSQASSATSETLERYFRSVGLDWRVDLAGRVIPQLSGIPSVQVVIPFRDQREHTLACVAAVRKDSYPALTITAVDNGSRDSTIRDTLFAQGVEVFRVDEPFNFSRLMNFAARRSSSDLILALNNDVRVRPGCIRELARWAMQPPVGVVGCALYHPDGTLLHGGIERSGEAPAGEAGWEEIERGRQRSDLDHAARLRVVDAVSGACAMMRRDVFGAVGGFDEVNYPVAFSDTDLAQRVRQRGLACVYTPHAEGEHDDGLSRRFKRLEDFEGSSWFAEYLGRAR